jgi:hypothetical protein
LNGGNAANINNLNDANADDQLDADGMDNDGLVMIEDEEVPLAVISDEDGVEGASTESSELGTMTTIEDEEVPQGQKNLDKRTGWLWWLPVIPFGAKVAYDKKHQKNLFAAKNKKKADEDNDRFDV